MVEMNQATDARDALRDLFKFHFGSHAWLPTVLMAIAVATLAMLLGAILAVGPGLVPPTFRVSLAYKTVACWVFSVACAYASGFVMGRLYGTRA